MNGDVKVMTKAEFKKRWESNRKGGGITNDDCADCAKAWGLYSTPRIHPMNEVIAKVLKAAGVEPLTAGESVG
jgi:hypothetical protein